ncbi:MAG: hypothetical protein U0359_27630 [Byssovorax sp.]
MLLRASVPALLALPLALLACGPATPAATEPISAGDIAAEPPLIHSGEAHLACTISAKENGTQRLSVVKGTGLEFDVAVSPIVDGTVNTKGPAKGGAYRFTSHLAAPGKGQLPGVGPVDIEDLDTKVNVEMNRYDQPGGPGTKLTFSSQDMASRGIYVEFAGHARSSNGERYAFRVTLGQPGAGSGGDVTPASPADNAPIYAKTVMIMAPITTVVTTTVTKLLSK